MFFSMPIKSFLKVLVKLKLKTFRLTPQFPPNSSRLVPPSDSDVRLGIFLVGAGGGTRDLRTEASQRS